MKQLAICLIVLFFIIPNPVSGQEIVYSEFNNEDNRDMNFEILGKMNGTYVIYKNIRWKHVLAFYDREMKIKKSMRLTFVPDKTFNIDFITYPDHFYMIYQYQKNNIIYCKAVKMDGDGKKLGDPVDLDTTKISLLADNKIYNTVYSQDKQRIMVYKMQRKNDQMTIATKLFDNNLKMIDSTREVSDFDSRRDIYSELLLDNDGRFVYAKGRKRVTSDDMSSLNIVFRKPGAIVPRSYAIDVTDAYLHPVNIKIDNLNKNYIINALFATQDRGNVKGLFSALIDAADVDTMKTAFHEFPDSLRQRINTDGQFRFAFDDLLLRNSVVKKDGGFILTAEDYSEQSTSSMGNGRWNRYNYLYNSPYSTNSDFYLTNPSYGGYYRPLSSFNNIMNVRYYYDNIMVMSLDSNLRVQWDNVIPKKQTDDDNDNFLSYSTMNVGSEIHFIYIEKDRNKQVISNHSIFPNGEVKRYPTLKSREIGFEFMPRFAKQVGFRELIVPCVYRSNIAFARINFFE